MPARLPLASSRPVGHPHNADRRACSPRNSTISIRSYFAGSRLDGSRASPRKYPFDASRTMTMRSSCAELRDATRCYAGFLRICQTFLKTHAPLLAPWFPESLTALTAAFDSFSQQVVALCSTLRRSALNHHFSQGSQLFQAATGLSSQWASFIEIVTAIAAGGVSAYSNEIRVCFGHFFEQLALIETRADEKCFIDREVSVFLAKSRRTLRSLQREFDRLILRVDEGTIEQDVQSGTYLNFFRSYMIALHTILDHVLPADIFGPVEVGMIKTELAVSSSCLVQIVDSTRLFRAQLAELIPTMVRLNLQFGDIFAFLSLPFTVVLVEEDFHGGG
jgi:hypothetical protein